MPNPYFVDDFLLTSIGRNPVALSMTNSGLGWYLIPYNGPELHQAITEIVKKHLHVTKYKDFSEGERGNAINSVR